MLTRLKVSGFKNLVNVDIRFGAFTCIAGANGVGKSNLFDAIRFLSALADMPLMEAALSVRDESGRTGDVRSLFHHVGESYAETMSFEVEMIIPPEGIDDLGQKARASITFLRYAITLKYREGDDILRSSGMLELLHEELTHITLGKAKEHVLFEHSGSTWRTSAVKGARRVSHFISTEGEDENRHIRLHQDGGSSGRPTTMLAANLPRTVLSSVNAVESPTALLARREMQSWRLLQLEPSSLRKPDEFNAPTRLGSDGSHLAATLYYLERLNQQRMAQNAGNGHGGEGQVYSQIANRLAELIDDVKSIWIDRDERRELLTLYVTARDGTAHPARALSDGTLRFLALAVLEQHPEAQELLCLEEPENGIHPERIPAMLQLLQDIATDVHEPVGSDNPLRQVIINTHSPPVVSQVPDKSLLVAELKETMIDGQRCKHVVFSAVEDTWRTTRAGYPPVSKGKLLAYLNPVAQEVPQDDPEAGPPPQRSQRRLIDRPDMQQLVLPFSTGEEA